MSIWASVAKRDWQRLCSKKNTDLLWSLTNKTSQLRSQSSRISLSNIVFFSESLSKCFSRNSQYPFFHYLLPIPHIRLSMLLNMMLNWITVYLVDVIKRLLNKMGLTYQHRWKHLVTATGFLVRGAVPGHLGCLESPCTISGTYRSQIQACSEYLFG